MIITRVLNNNVVEATDYDLGEIVVMGSGIGYRKKKNDIVDPEKVQKIFVIKDYTNFKDLLAQVPAVYLELTSEIVNYANRILPRPLKDDIYVLFTDHLYFAIKRIEEGVELDNPFLVDVRAFYKDEYEIAIHACEIIKQTLNIDIPDYEVGYIAMHIIESEYDQQKRDFSKIFSVINTCVSYIRKAYLAEIKEGSLAYIRLLNHIKYFAKRYVEHKSNEVSNDLLNKTIKKVFSEESRVINGLSTVLYTKYGNPISEAEKNYLILHIRNCAELSD